MMKKIAVLAGAGALVLALAGPAFGFTINKAKVDNSTTAVANTGISAGNVATVSRAHVDGDVEVGGTNVVKQLHTGDANALAVGGVVANTQVGCDACGGGFTVNKAKVRNATVADAETGVLAGGGVSVDRAHIDGEIEVEGTNIVKQLHTGNANSRSFGIVVVNTQWTD